MNQSDLARAILRAAGLPYLKVAGAHAVLQGWHEIVTLVDREEDDRAAVLARERAERLLKKLCYFHASTGCASSFIDVIRTPGNMRLSPSFKTVLDMPEAEQLLAVAKIFTEDDSADLGLLTILSRKVSAELERRSSQDVGGRIRLLVSAREQEVF